MGNVNIMHLLTLFEVIKCSSEFKCPVQSQWNSRAGSKCNSTQQYICLFDENILEYAEFCAPGPHFERPGYKQILIGGLSRRSCSPDRYQPFLFWTNESSVCAYQKSNCTDEGQILYDNGLSRVDRTCHCDYRRNYSFAVTPEEKCYCVPSKEDCSCHIKSCPDGHLLDPDYECTAVQNWKTTFSCREIGEQSDVVDLSSKVMVTTIITENENGIKNRYGVTIICIIIIICICLFTESVYLAARKKLQGWCFKKDEHMTQMDAVSKEEITKDVSDFTGQSNNIDEQKTLMDAVLLEEITEEVSDITDEQNRVLEKWRERHKYVAVTRAIKHALEEISHRQFLIVTGPPGSGKSFIAYYVAFKQEEHGYSVIPISKPKDIRKYAFENRKRILLFDDAFGRYSLHKIIFEMWRKEEKFIKRILIDNEDIKIMATCRSHIYRENVMKELQLHPVDCDLLSDNLKLIESERIQMCKAYLKPSIMNELNEGDINLYNFFPLLCSSFTVYEEQTAQSFFCNPTQFLKHELEQMKEKSDVTYLALALLVVLNNNVEKKMLEVFDYEIDVLIRDVFNESGLQAFPSKTLIFSSMNTLVGTYLMETNACFSFLHTKLFDNVSFCIGDKIILSILKHGDSAFIRDRFQFLSLNEQHSDLTIMINEQQEGIYFDRLLHDIKCGRNWDAIKNKQFEFSRYRQKLKTFLENKLVKDYIKKDVDDGSTPLHVVANVGIHDLFQVLFSADEDQIIAKDNKGRTPLHVASEKGNVTFVKKLLDNAPTDITDIPDNDNYTPLHFACANGHCNVAKLLIKSGAKVNRNGYNKRTALHLACKYGYMDIIDLLLKNGADIKFKDSNDGTPLHIACLNNQSDVVKCIMSFKNKINSKDKYGRTVLFIACEVGNETIVQLLLKQLEYNASVNISNKNGEFPLHMCCVRENLVITKCLLEHGADVDVQDKSGSTPLYIACRDGRENVVDVLIKHQANVNKPDNDGKTPLFASCSEGHTTIVRALLSEKADINKLTREGFSPLYIASSENNFETVKLLIESGAVVNVLKKKYDSSLHAACRKGHVEIADYLIKYGAKINMKNRDGFTPLHIASNRTITDMLLRYHADR